MSGETSDIVVIGAGIVGVSSAIRLRRDGHRVTLLDPLGAGQATSYGNAGVVAVNAIVPVTVPGLIAKVPKMLFDPMSPLYLRWRYLPRLLPWLVPYLRQATDKRCRQIADGLSLLLLDAVEQHQAIVQGGEAEQWIVPSDYLFAYRDRAAYEGDRYNWALRAFHGLQSEVIEGAAVQDYDPAFGPAVGLLVRCPDHATIKDPGKYVAALAQQFVAEGGRILEAEARDIKTDGGRVSAVVTDEGEIRCERVVIAAGPWSARLTKRLGLKTPLEAERGYHIEFENPDVMPRAPAMVAAGKFVATPMEGRLRCAGVVEFGGLDAPESEAPVKMLEARVREVFPDLKTAKTRSWMGRRPATIDSLPFLGEAPSIKGLYCAFGHQHIGLTSGPKTGRLLADLVAGRHANRDLGAYRVDRFE